MLTCKMDTIEEFCGSQFWDPDLSWNTEKSKLTPDLTPCFQNTVLVWIPCAFLWIFSIFNLIQCSCSSSNKNLISEDEVQLSHPISDSSSTSRHSRAVLTRRSLTDPISWNVFNGTKVVICLLLILTQVLRLSSLLKLELSQYIVYPVDKYTPILRICTYALVLASIVISMRKGTRSSIIQFTFWLLLTICQLFKFRTTILTAYNNVNKGSEMTMTTIVELIDYPLIVGQLLLHCWADSNRNENITRRPEEIEECPQKNASVLNHLFLSWFDSLAWKGYRKSLETKDLWDLNDEEKSKVVSEIFDENWSSALSKIQRSNLRRSSARVSVLSILFSSFGTTFLVGLVISLIPDLLAFASPQILRAMIAFIDSDQDNWKGYFYAVLLFLSAFISTLGLAHYHNLAYTLAIRVKSALVSVLYRKSLVISNATRKEYTTGEIVNLMSVDVQNVLLVLPFLRFWSAPIQIALALYFLWDMVGPSIFAGVGVMVLLIPVNGVLSNIVRSYQVKQMTNKDERVKLISEILSGIKILKLYAWEPSFQEEVMKVRNRELKTLKTMTYLNSVNEFLWACSQFIVTIATFATYVLVDSTHVLDAQKIFVTISLINVMTIPLTMLPMLVVWALQASVSLGRLTKFLNSEEIDSEAITHNEDEVHPIVIENGYFSWERNSDSKTNQEANRHGNNVLNNINLKVQEGSLVAVVGPVGSGKSSLLSAILGEIEKTSGRVNTKGSISYVAQQAWIQNGTLRENVLFGKPYNANKYNRVIDACALGPDLDILPGNDKTEIGEKGINLSGGQKQRVSIARAVHNNSDLYLMDDPLSAVDSHVGKHIFEKVLSSKGLLGRKTRVLATNSLHFLNQVDNIIVMKNGEISETGTYDELMAQKGEFANLINQYTNDNAEEVQVEDQEETTEISATTTRQRRDSNLESSGEKSGEASIEERVPDNTEKLISNETMETTAVKWTVYLDYFRAAGWSRVILGVFMYALYQEQFQKLAKLLFLAFAVGSNFWLSAWTNEPIVNGTQGNRDLYLGVYAGLGIGQSIAFVIATVTICLATIRSSTVFHMNMLSRILRAPMSFFDTTPTGRILNRFSKDVDVMDRTLDIHISNGLLLMTNIISTLTIITYSTPVFAAVIVPIGIFYYLVQKFYVPTSRQLKRLESVTRSPIFSHFSETINGASTIRAYGVQQRFITESETKQDANQVCKYPSTVSNIWMTIRLEMAGNLVIFFTALFAVLTRDNLNPGLVGLTVSYSLQITYSLNYLIRHICELETNIVAVERLKEYGEIPQEASWNCQWKKLSNTWPAIGSVQFKNYQTRYREGLNLVLRNITCNIQPCEKIGVVGRTGAGKSSLTLALFRIIEGEDGGSITVDGEDIQKIGLHDIRSRLTIIPQDPILFSGTLRFNLDPFTKYSDSAVWRALELSNLKTFVEGLQGELQFKVSEGGDNMSVGQKQLVCLARALLRKSKILVLDEATATVDVETDDLIQKTIRSEFKDSTVITIAHRLNTIMDSNRVMVIDNGTISEFDSPGTLLENTKSQFYAMALDAGLISNVGS